MIGENKETVGIFQVHSKGTFIFDNCRKNRQVLENVSNI